jgi:urate oxidase
MSLISNSYGKGRVRIMRVNRQGEHHEVRELSLLVMLQGDFERAYTHADNRAVIATDSIKNIVNVTAREQVAASPEAFCQAVASKFLSTYTQVKSVTITAAETRWTRLAPNGTPHPHAFLLDANGKPTVKLVATRDSATLDSGIEGFTFMKSTGSGWTDFVQDEFATLPETTDRIAATSMNASWRWASPPQDFAAASSTILATMLAEFANTYSAGIQDSLYRMGEAALAAVPEVASITLSCPNKHYVPINLTPFGLSADNLVFTPTDEPHGQIECCVGR